MTDSIASGLKDNRRLATFRMENAEEFVEYLKTRYDSEIDLWVRRAKKSDWKYEFILNEDEIRRKVKRIARLQELVDLW